MGRQNRRSVRALLIYAVDDSPAPGVGKGRDVPTKFAPVPGTVRKLTLVVQRQAFADLLLKKGL
jgi:hypothetical protein